MMMQFKEIFMKYKFLVLTIVISIILIIIGVSITVYERQNMLYLNNNNYYIEYDKTWKLVEDNNELVKFRHSTDSTVTIKTIELKDEYKYSDIDDLIDKIIYKINEQNKSYNLLFSDKDTITKYGFNGYELLFESGGKQAMVQVYKKSDKLVLVEFEAKNEYFDILLDSVDNIIFNLNVKEKTYNLKTKLNLKTSEISFNKNQEIDKEITSSNNYEIAMYHYLVKYSIPSIFVENKIDSNYGNYIAEFDLGRIEISSSIVNSNIYEYLDKNKTGNLWSHYSVYKEDDDYSKFKESIEKINGKYEGFIYKNSYYYDKAMSFDDNGVKNVSELKENVELIYALDNNHIFKIVLESNKIPITKKIINSIKIKSVNNYSTFIKSKTVDNHLVFELKNFTDYNKTKIDSVEVKIPIKYVEIDKNNNLYSEMNFGLNYNDNFDLYDYDISYKLIDETIESFIKTYNDIYIYSSYDKSNKMKYSGYLTSNNKNFFVYDGGYDQLSGILFMNTNRKKYYKAKKMLFYKLSDERFLCIELSGNGKEISKSIINDVTNFNVSKKNIK